MAGSNKSKGRKTVEYGRYGYFFIAPFFIVYAAFQLWPLLYTIGLSFCELFTDPMWNQTVGPNFNGIANYKEVLFSDEGKFLDTYTINALWNTMLMWVINFVPQIVLALILAAWFTDTKVKLRGQGAYKIMVFMPNIITAATISVLFYSLFNYPAGPINIKLQDWGLISEPFNFLNSKWSCRLIISFINFWMWYGNTMIVLTAGVLGISPSLFEAARIDGSKEFATFNRIAMPLLKPAVATQCIFAFIGSWNNFYTPSMILSKQDKYTLPMFIQLLRGERFRSDYGIIYVGLVITVIPIFVVYFALSKYIIAGVALGGVKE